MPRICNSGGLLLLIEAAPLLDGKASDVIVRIDAEVVGNVRLVGGRSKFMMTKVNSNSFENSTRACQKQ
jgi:hypothetical protein